MNRLSDSDLDRLIEQHKLLCLQSMKNRGLVNVPSTPRLTNWGKKHPKKHPKKDPG